MAALVFKVGALALKTLAKPLGDRFKNWVMTHPNYRQTVLSAAQVRQCMWGSAGSAACILLAAAQAAVGIATCPLPQALPPACHYHSRVWHCVHVL